MNNSRINSILQKYTSLKSNNKFVFFILAIILIFFLITLFLSEGYYGGPDSLTHYRFSRYSWQKPEFLLDHWAKPVFTLLSSPFAQFGHTGVSVFNIILGILTAYLCYRIVTKLGYSFPLYVVVLVCFIPVYTINMLSGLTEILFGFFIIWSVYLCLYERYTFAAIVTSFMPLVRTEGIVILPIIVLFMVFKKKYYVLPLFITGFVVYSIIGYFVYKDIFWLITLMPYRGATDVYGTGPLLHFVKQSHVIFSGAIVILTCIGLANLAYNFIKNAKVYTNQVLLIALPFIVYFSAHSVMWWSGIGNSLGLYRYMAACAPLAAILSLYGLNAIYVLIKNRQSLKIAYSIFLILLLVSIVRFPIKKYGLPQKMWGADVVINEASDYIIEKGLNNNKIYFYDPAFFYFLELNPFDTIQCKEFVYDSFRPEFRISENSILIWDAHFSPLHKLTKDNLLNSKHFELLEKFRPEQTFKVFDRDYEVLVFQRRNDFDSTLNINKYNKKEVKDTVFNQVYYEDFQNELVENNKNIILLNDTNKVFDLKSTEDYALTYKIKKREGIKGVHCKIDLILEDSMSTNYPYLVVEKRSNKLIDEYFSNNIPISNSHNGKNKKLQLTVELKKSLKNKNLIKIYIWNPHKVSCYLDNYYIGIR